MAKMVGFSVKDGSVTGAMRQLLKQLLEKKLVDAVLVPLELPSRENVVQSLVTRAEVLDAANPLAPVLPVTTANIISKMTRLASSQKKVAVVARPCELRALIELVKLKQASLNNIVLVGVDCYGTYSVPDYKQFGKGNQAPGDEFMKGARAGQADTRLREACQICEYPYPSAGRHHRRSHRQRFRQGDRAPGQHPGRGAAGGRPGAARGQGRRATGSHRQAGR